MDFKRGTLAAAMIVALAASFSPAQGSEQANPHTAAEAKAEPKAADQSEESLKKQQAKAAMAAASAGASAAAGNMAVPKSDGKPQTLSEQLKEALDGKASGTLNLSKPKATDARPAAKSADAHVLLPAKSAMPPVKPMSDSHGTEKPAVAAHLPAGMHAAARLFARKRAEAVHAAHGSWSYDGETGPEHWAELDPAFALCKQGSRQSPILIESDKTMAGPGDDLSFFYVKSEAKILNNGHTFQVDLAEGSKLVARGETYKLVEFNFHHPSEERIDYKGFPMVAHLVHKSVAGTLAVVAVEFEIGAENPAVEQAWRSIPLDVGDKAGILKGIDPNELLPAPAQRQYFQFLGSLTTPPCSEGVLWMVLKTPMTISRQQLATFTRFFPLNSRPVQPVNGRLVRELE